ncbi:protein LNK1-like [Cornus florida]|uniref:protein LNK1-like n=1 Tax=Cornus florida TaxID=4283 RepID=UPI0028A1E892|nr:protein LNK1-like [Cornus florida]
MSDLCMYELEDIGWQEFGQEDDHIVPHPDDKHESEISHTKSQYEVIGVSSSDGYQCAANYVTQVKEEGDFSTCKNRRNKMLEKDSWAHTPEGVSPASCDGESIKEESSLSDNSRMPSHCFKSSNVGSVCSEFCADDPINGDRSAAVDNNSYCYPLDHDSQTDKDLSFLVNDCEDKESSDLFYYEWPDIENFEDVDRMFSGCDTTFGLGDVGNEDDLGWFSSSHAIEGSDDLLKSDFKFSCPESSPSKNIPEHSYKLDNSSSVISDFNMENAPVSYKSSYQTSKDYESAALDHLPFMNVSDLTSESKDEFTQKEQINSHKKHSKHHNQSVGRRKGRCLENGGSYHHSGKLQSKDTKLPSQDSSCPVFPSPGVRQQTQNMRLDSFGHLRTHNPYIHPDIRHRSNQISVSPVLSAVKYKNNGLASLSQKESSYASNQVQSVERSHDYSFEAPAMEVNEKRKKPFLRQGFQTSCRSNHKHTDSVVQAAPCSPISVWKRQHSENEVENPSDAEEVSMGISAELEFTNVQDSSCLSSELNEISQEATSFRQLQHVMEQLDIRTKLCIRDSLYRLARSAERRHNCANLNGGSRDDTGGALMDEGTNKCNGFMDIETNTNPIDRSIAHLLFHRPLDSSVMPAHDALSNKSHMVHGLIASPPVKAENLVCQEETAAEADKKVADQ